MPGSHHRRIRSRQALITPGRNYPRETARDPGRPRARWPTSSLTPPRNAGGGSTATSSSPTCSPGVKYKDGVKVTDDETATQARDRALDVVDLEGDLGRAS